MPEKSRFRCGFTAIVGRPNVGKSTLLNHLVGQKLSITARKPQTTRHRLLAVTTTRTFQVAYVDTPGIHGGQPRAINRYMNRVAHGAIDDVDVVLFMVEAPLWTDADERVLRRLAGVDKPVMLLINKIDRLTDKTALLPYIAAVSKRGDFADVIPISARRKSAREIIEPLVVALLPLQDPIFPADVVTDRSERFLAAEFVREKLTRKLGSEVPYRLSVEIEQFTAHRMLIEISAVIWVERRSQKAIVVGRGGLLLKAVGKEARRDMETAFHNKVNLKLWVKVKQGWSNDERALLRLGYVP